MNGEVIKETESIIYPELTIPENFAGLSNSRLGKKVRLLVDYEVTAVSEDSVTLKLNNFLSQSKRVE